jgi:hypothetical protein
MLETVEQDQLQVRFQVLTVESIKIRASWEVVPSSLVGID